MGVRAAPSANTTLDEVTSMNRSRRRGLLAPVLLDLRRLGEAEGVHADHLELGGTALARDDLALHVAVPGDLEGTRGATVDSRDILGVHLLLQLHPFLLV